MGHGRLRTTRSEARQGLHRVVGHGREMGEGEQPAGGLGGYSHTVDIRGSHGVCVAQAHTGGTGMGTSRLGQTPQLGVESRARQWRSPRTGTAGGRTTRRPWWPRSTP